MIALQFMGEGEPEFVRGRVYGAESAEDTKKRALLTAMANAGVIECPAYDNWLAALEGRGFAAGELEPAPEYGPGAKVMRWRLTDAGQRWWKELDR